MLRDNATHHKCGHSMRGGRPNPKITAKFSRPETGKTPEKKRLELSELKQLQRGLNMINGKQERQTKRQREREKQRQKGSEKRMRHKETAMENCP